MARLSVVLACVLLWLAGCAVELQNRQAARDIAQRSKPPGSVYTGWRVYQDRCAACHGATATGTARAPDLLPRIREMGEHRFVGIVLNRYEWGLPAQEGLVDDVVQRKRGELAMPVWQDEPRVTAHIADLYAYLSARADGSQGPGRPVR